MVASSPSRQALHLLVVAASGAEVERLRPVLGRSDEIHRVDSADFLRAALADQPWDAVLYLSAVAALSLPNALRQIDDAGLDLPLILVAGPAEERGTAAGHEGRRPRRDRRRPAGTPDAGDRARSARSAPSRRPPRRAGNAQ
jgi:hypothetical protein